MARFRRDEASLAPLLSRARLAEGKTLGAARLLDANLTLEAVAAILVEDGLTTSAIEGERLDLDALRSSVARRLRLPTAGLPSPPRAVDGLIDVLLDVTRRHDAPLSAAQRGHCSNASTVEMLIAWLLQAKWHRCASSSTGAKVFSHSGTCQGGPGTG